MIRETVKQRHQRLAWALLRIAEVTAIPEAKRDDLDYLRSACSLAHIYAKAGVGLAPRAQLDLPLAAKEPQPAH